MEETLSVIQLSTAQTPETVHTQSENFYLLIFATNFRVKDQGGFGYSHTQQKGTTLFNIMQSNEFQEWIRVLLLTHCPHGKTQKINPTTLRLCQSLLCWTFKKYSSFYEYSWSAAIM